MIKRLYIDNFKSLVNFELQLQDLTLLLGPNGVGKTSVLDGDEAKKLLDSIDVSTIVGLRDRALAHEFTSPGHAARLHRDRRARALRHVCA